MHIIVKDNRDNSHQSTALLDTGADANFVSDEVVSALNLRPTSYHSDEGFMVGNGKSFSPRERVSVDFRILHRIGSSYSDSYKGTFFVVTAGFGFILGQKFCKENRVYEQISKFAIFIHRQTKGKGVSVHTEEEITDITANSVQGYV